jgi:hypothetical protein
MITTITKLPQKLFLNSSLIKNKNLLQQYLTTPCKYSITRGVKKWRNEKMYKKTLINLAAITTAMSLAFRPVIAYSNPSLL